MAREKIIYIQVKDLPDGIDPFKRENFQRNSILKGLFEADDNDLIIISDLDEMMHTTLVAINPSLAAKEGEAEGEDPQKVALDAIVSKMKEEFEEVKRKNSHVLEEVKGELARVRSQMEQLSEKYEGMQSQMVVNDWN